MYNEDLTRQKCYWLYKCGLRWNQNWTIRIDQKGSSLSWKANMITMWLCDLSKIRYWIVKTNQIVCILWGKWDKTAMLQIVQVWSLKNMILNCQHWSDSVWFMMKMRQDKDVTGCTSPLYAKNKIELSCSILQGAVYEDD